MRSSVCLDPLPSNAEAVWLKLNSPLPDREFRLLEERLALGGARADEAWMASVFGRAVDEGICSGWMVTLEIETSS